jgi:hypothetical protein
VAHYAVADPNRQAPQPHSGPRAVRLHPLGSRGLVTSGGLRLGNALPSVVADPSFEVDSSISKSFRSIGATARSLRPLTTSPVPTVCTQNGFCPSVATMTLASTAPRVAAVSRLARGLV